MAIISIATMSRKKPYVLLNAFSLYFLSVDASLTIHAQVNTFAGFVVQKYRVVGRPSYKMNKRPPFPPVTRT